MSWHYSLKTLEMLINISKSPLLRIIYIQATKNHQCHYQFTMEWDKGKVLSKCTLLDTNDLNLYVLFYLNFSLKELNLKNGGTQWYLRSPQGGFPSSHCAVLFNLQIFCLPSRVSDASSSVLTWSRNSLLSKLR